MYRTLPYHKSKKNTGFVIATLSSKSKGKPKKHLSSCNNGKGSTWDNTLAAMKGVKKPTKKKMTSIDAVCLLTRLLLRSPQRHTSARKLWTNAAINATLVIPHPTANDQLKCIACKTTVAQYMAMPKNLIEGKRYDLDLLHA